MSNGLRAAWWWIDRWRRSTAYTDMTAEERGVYRELLDEVWQRPNHIIPDDPLVFARLAGGADVWARCSPKVLRWMQREAGGWTNATAMDVIKQSQEFRDRQAAKGRTRAAQAAREGGRFTSRKPAGNQPEHQPEHQPETSLPSPSPSPSPDPEVSGTSNPTGSLQKGAQSRAVRWTLPRELDSEPVLEALRDWGEMRRRRRSPLTQLAADRAVKRLARLSASHPQTAVAIVEASTDGGWTKFYELSEGRPDPRAKGAWLQGLDLDDA